MRWDGEWFRNHRRLAVGAVAVVCGLAGLLVGYAAGRAVFPFSGWSSPGQSLASPFDHTPAQATWRNGYIPTRAEAEADRQARSERRRSLVYARLVGVAPADTGGVRLSLELTNVSGRDIKGLDGAALLYDRRGQYVSGFALKLDKAFPAGSILVKQGQWLVDDPTAAALDRWQKTTFAFEAREVLYSDGELEDLR